jgi:hypothetical protein
MVSFCLCHPWLRYSPEHMWALFGEFEVDSRSLVLQPFSRSPMASAQLELTAILLGRTRFGQPPAVDGSVRR